MTYLDFDLLIEPTQQTGEYRARVLASPMGQAERLFTLPFDEKDLRIFVLSMGRTRREVRSFLDSTEISHLEERGLIQLTRLEAGTLAALQRKLRKEQFHIFHFIGHGGFDEQNQEGILLLEDENQRGRRISGHYLGTILHDHRSLRLALLNSCEGARTAAADPFAGVAQHLVLQGLPAVIAMQFEITDAAAILLVREFYEALADGYAVDAALAEARKAIFAAGNDVEWGTPVLYMRATDGRLFELADIASNAEGGGRSAESQPISVPMLKPAEPAKPKLQPIWQQIGIEMVKIAAGEFLYGDDKRKIILPEFCIAKTPVTNQQYKAFVDTAKQRAPSHWQEGKIPAGKENHPVVHVSWDDAQAFCKWAEVQLPSEQQWEKAGRGTDGRTYPWGEKEPDRMLCNFGNSEKDTTPVGKYPDGASPYGLLDMAGNVWKWCEDWYDESKRFRVLRGGSFHNESPVMRCAYRDYRDLQDDLFGYGGFRVVGRRSLQ